MIIAITGHRSEDCRSEEDVRRRFRETFEDVKPDVVICGMAAGVDLWAADEARLLGIEVWAARPWNTHIPRRDDLFLYTTILDYASKVVVVTETDQYPGPWVYHRRNEWMVDHATDVWAYWSGKEAGGTFACINYARRKEVPINNVY